MPWQNEGAKVEHFNESKMKLVVEHISISTMIMCKCKKIYIYVNENMYVYIRHC